MRGPLTSLVLIIALAAQSGTAKEPPREAQSDAQALQQRAADLERLIAELDKELLHVRRQLAKVSGRGVTPQEAVEQFKRFPKEPVTVEFGVEPIGFPDGPIREGDDTEPAIMARWDNYLVGGGTMTAIVPAKVYRQLTLPTKDGGKTVLSPGQERKQVARHIEEHGIRVTGILEPTGINGDQYLLRAEEPGSVVLYIKGSGR